MDPFTLLFVGATAASVGSLAALHLGKVVVPRVGRWRNPPPVYVEAGGPLDLDTVRWAVQFWRDAGFELGRVSEFHAIEPASILAGAIVVVGDATMAQPAAAQWTVEYALAEDEADPQGHVTNVTDVVGEIDGGYIRHALVRVAPIEPGHDPKLIAIHELGHALGFGHCETALFGRRKRDRKNSKAQAGDARRVLGLKVVGRKTGHVMNPYIGTMGKSTKGMAP